MSSSIIKESSFVLNLVDTDMCRLCLAKDLYYSQRIFGEDGQENDIKSKIETLLQTEVFFNDNWPQIVCRHCSEKLTLFQSFFDMAKSTEGILLDKFGGQRLTLDYDVTNIECLNTEEGESISIMESIEELEEKIVEKDQLIELKEVIEEIEEPVELMLEDPPEDQEDEDYDSKDVLKVSKKPSKKDKKASKVESSTKLSDSFSTKCGLCSYNSPSLEYLKTHFGKKHKKESFFVKCCGKKYDNSPLIREHFDFHKRKRASPRKLSKNQSPSKDQSKLARESCDQVSPDQKQSAEHKSDDNKERFLCDQCDRSYSALHNLHYHIKHTHSDDKPEFICKECSKVFKSKDTLKHHMVQHMDKPPRIRCEVCDKTFLHKSGMKRHMQIHTKGEDEKFICNICNKESPTKRALYLHKRYVHNPETFECSICPKTFKRAIYLKEHMASHTGDFIYKCRFCNKKFNSNANMYAHQKTKHQEEWEEEKKKILEKNESSVV